jgi:DNA replication protein DnaC
MTLVEAISHQMIELRLTGMREIYGLRAKQAREPNLTCEDFFALLMPDEIEFRKGDNIKHLLRTAALRCPSSLEEMDAKVDRGLDKKQLRELASCRLIDDGPNILILGPTGVGKTHTASGIGNAACRQAIRPCSIA